MVKKSEKCLTSILLYDIFKIEDMTKDFEFENKKGGSMKKFAVLFLGSVLLFAASGLAFAQEGGEFFYSDNEIAGRMNIAVRGGVVLPVNAEDSYVYGYVTGPQRLSIKRKNGWFAGAELTYDLGDYLAVGAEGYYQEYKIDNTIAFNGMTATSNLGKARNSMVFGKFILKYAFDLEDFSFVPYVAGAPGGIFPTFKNSSAATANNVTVKTRSGFAAKYSGGFDFYIMDNFAINVEGGYLMATIKTAVTAGTNTAKNDIKNDAVMVGGGLKYRF